MSKEISIMFRNVIPVISEEEHDSTIELWLEVEEYFKLNHVNYNDEISFKILLDSTQIRKKLEQLKPENCESFLEDYIKSHRGLDLENQHPFSAILKIEIQNISSTKPLGINVLLKHFIQQLFLVMNMCSKGGCNVGSFSLEDINEEETYTLHSDLIECSWQKASKDNWPILCNIIFSDAWKWMERNGGLSFFMAEKPINMAWAVLLHLASKGEIEATDVVQITQVLESFYLNEREPKVRGLTRKIPAVIGNIPENNICWIKELYNIRSKIVHGNFPIFRTHYRSEDVTSESMEDCYWEIVAAIDKGISIILGTIQDLITKDADYYLFEEKIHVIPQKNIRE